ncbi:unnamed protein product [Chilo suppressalis]|uniref:BPTI/Kunitz inhibitor domain-containing protein n=1 Tax=Chilo suppressalis TaxID=168631 RepID=A0ABN8L3Z6_CHISP|nr:unnamed protein product [Chilo suppressalis]
MLVEDISDYGVLCKFQPNEYDCEKKGRYPTYGFYYDIKMEDCKTAQFGTCPHNVNNFKTLSICQDTCRDAGQETIKRNLSADIFCRLQPDFGNCNDYYPMWYFDMSQHACKGFSFSGCGGNANRFHTAQICTAKCAAVLAY